MNSTEKKILGIGHRIRIAITLTGLRINEFCKKSGLPSGTIWAWYGERLPLTKKGALRLSESLFLFGVKCSPEWLLLGTGHPPTSKILSSETVKIESIIDSQLTSELAIIKEVEFFQSINAKHKVIAIRDDSMIPFYEPGDYVGGYQLEKENFPKATNKNCIIKTKENLILIRKLNKGSKKGLFTLTCTNFSSKSKNQLLVDVEPEEVSVIIWHRKKFLLQN